MYVFVTVGGAAYREGPARGPDTARETQCVSRKSQAAGISQQLRDTRGGMPGNSHGIDGRLAGKTL